MNITTIIEKLKTDKAFAEKYANLSGIEAILEQAKQDGYDVSREDVEAVLKKFGGTGKVELGEDDLAVVAGGKEQKYCDKCKTNYYTVCFCPD